MTDYYLGTNVITKTFRPKWTTWKCKTVTKDKKAHKRRERRSYKHYLKTGRLQDFNRSQKKLTKWDFD